MVIDSSAVVILPNEGEFKAKKKETPAEIKPVETSGKNTGSELDLKRDKITEKTPEQRNFDVGSMYSKNGSLNNDASGSQGTGGMSFKSIDVIV